jgi:hypothetical protein
VSLHAKLGDLKLHIEGCRLEGRVTRVKSGWERHTTVVRLEGAGQVGLGEDVTYHAGDQAAFRRRGQIHPLAGDHTLDSFSAVLDRLELFEQDPNDAASRDYRRWAFEAAALDLALLQSGLTLHGILGIEPGPVQFVVSMGLPAAPALDPIPSFLRHDPGLRLKLDATSRWTDETVRQLAATGAVEVVDLKGFYHDTPVDQPPDAEMYRRVAEGLPGAWIEDPALTVETSAVLRDHRPRITWDAPIHSVADIEALPFVPRVLNIKPSRFGTLRRLLDAYDHCNAHGIRMYGGGQFELGPGRAQIQYLASLFHPAAPNDVAPIIYHDTAPREGLPRSPLVQRPAPAGFARGETETSHPQGVGPKEQP